jgi:ribosomal protein S18 acetylase RimI-like enzyme
MSDRPLIPLAPVPIELDAAEFKEICGWPFADLYVGRLLRDDTPQRMQFGNGRTWVYRDPDNRLVGFGTIDVSDDCRDYTAGQLHPYIPLLAVNPTTQRCGHGTSIVRHLIGEAAILWRLQGDCHDVLFLDVYTVNVGAISLYQTCGFETITSEPILDPLEDDKPYIIMAKRVSIAPTLNA